MPELPEVEAVCRIAARALRGRRIVSAQVLRGRICLPQTPEQFAAAVAGRRFERAERRGKNILLHLGPRRRPVSILVHLRMTGNLYAVADARLRAATVSAYLELENGRALVFDDPRGLGVMRALTPKQVGELLANIGIDPLSKQFTTEALADLAHATRAPIKLFLMDQRRVAGIGNIYAAEALWRAGIDPRRAARSLSRDRLRKLRAAIVSLLTQATPSALRAYSRPGAFTEGESFKAAVYDREGEACPRCGARIRRIPQGGRSTYFCPRCQT